MRTHQLFALTFLLLTFNSYCQSITYEIGEAVSSFDYENSAVNTIELEPSVKTYMGIGYKQPLKKHINLVTSLHYNHYGASGYTKIINNDYFLQWDLHYLALNLGANFDWNRDLITLYTEVTGSYEFLLKGQQYINAQPFNVRGQEEFDNQFIYYRGTIGASYEVTREVDFFIQYTFGRSLPLTDKTASSTEKLVIQTHKIGIGVQIDMTYGRFSNFRKPKFR